MHSFFSGPDAPPDLQSIESSRSAWNGLTPGAVGLPSGVSGASSATEIPMFSYDAASLVSYVALERILSPGLRRTPQYGRPTTSIEKSHDVGGPPGLVFSLWSQYQARPV